MLYGCIMCSASACAMLSCFWLSAASSSPTRRYGAGARNSAGTLPAVCAAAVPDQATSGTSTRRSSGSWAFSIIFGRRGHGLRHLHDRPGRARRQLECRCRTAEVDIRRPKPSANLTGSFSPRRISTAICPPGCSLRRGRKAAWRSRAGASARTARASSPSRSSTRSRIGAAVISALPR